MRTSAEVERWVHSRAAESDVLDFKEVFWPGKDAKPRSEEIAKDLAAYLNHRGGTIVIGVSDEDDRASGFSSAPLPERADQVVLSAARKHLVPNEATAYVHPYVVRCRAGDAEYEVLVVTVDAWPHGPVAVRSTDGQSYRIPVRHGTHTENMPWEQAMRELDGANRRMWLRFQEWSSTSKTRIYFGTRIRALAGGEAVDIPSVYEEPFASLARVEQDSVRFRLLRTAYVRWLMNEDRFIAMAQQRAKQGSIERTLVDIARLGGASEAWTNTGGSLEVAVPYELIRAAWLEERPDEARLHVVLDADLLFTGHSWMLRPTYN